RGARQRGRFAAAGAYRRGLGGRRVLPLAVLRGLAVPQLSLRPRDDRVRGGGGAGPRRPGPTPALARRRRGRRRVPGGAQRALRRRRRRRRPAGVVGRMARPAAGRPDRGARRRAGADRRRRGRVGAGSAARLTAAPITRALLIHPGALGDVLLALPALAHLARLAPGVHRVLAVAPRLAVLLDGSAYAEEAIDLEALALHRLFVAGGDPAAVERLAGYDA